MELAAQPFEGVLEAVHKAICGLPAIFTLSSLTQAGNGLHNLYLPLLYTVEHLRSSIWFCLYRNTSDWRGCDYPGGSTVE